MKLKIFFILFLVAIFNFIILPEASALLSPHPIQMYEKGLTYLNNYHGDKAVLHEADAIFEELIEKYPDSPFGYLGLSRIHVIDSYLWGSHYNMQKIRHQALPFAVKALELGPSLKDVHDHYTVIEKIFDQYEFNQQEAQDCLALFPQSPETFHIIGDFIRDHGENEKALEYYKIALDLNPGRLLRTKILKRIALIYLFEYEQPEKAVEYYKQLQEIDGDSPIVNKYLGIAYLKMRKYRLATEKLTKSFESLGTENLKYLLIQAKGYLFAEEDKFEQAIDLLEKVSKYEKENSTLHYHLGNLYYRLANYENAYNHFKKVIELTPKQSEAYYFAGRSAQLLGKEKLANDYYRKYLQLDASSQLAEWVRENIPGMKPKIIAADNSAAILSRDHDGR